MDRDPPPGCHRTLDARGSQPLRRGLTAIPQRLLRYHQGWQEPPGQHWPVLLLWPFPLAAPFPLALAFGLPAGGMDAGAEELHLNHMSVGTLSFYFRPKVKQLVPRAKGLWADKSVMHPRDCDVLSTLAPSARSLHTN